MTDLIQFGWFSTHSKFILPWKIDCDALTDGDIESIAKLIRWKFAFGDVYGIPRGGERLAKALKPHCDKGYPLLIVDDVLTTGKSMIEAKKSHQDATLDDLDESRHHPSHAIGVVIFARGVCPDWVWPIFSVNEWAQSRATGLG